MLLGFLVLCWLWKLCKDCLTFPNGVVLRSFTPMIGFIFLKKTYPNPEFGFALMKLISLY